MSQHREIFHPGGWKRFVRFPRLYDAWLVLTGQFSLHRAWQSGYDQHIADDSKRILYPTDLAEVAKRIVSRGEAPEITK